jgi:hypothetical protein
MITIMDKRKPSDKPTTPDPKDTPKKRTFKEIPLVSVPDDRDTMAEEMADLFDEDKVTHKHGNSEPEAD